MHAIGWRCRKIWIGKVATLFVVELDVQVLKGGELNAKRAAAAVNILSVEFILCLDGGSGV